MEKQIVVFELGSEYFGIDIVAVEGIVKLQEITKIPQAPSYMEGITNLRGSVLAVIDLARRFGLPVQEQTRESRIMVVFAGEVKIGMIVSAVSEVLTIDESVIEPPPPMASVAGSEFITGVAKIDKRLVIMLDLGKVLSLEEKIQVTNVLSGKK